MYSKSTNSIHIVPPKHHNKVRARSPALNVSRSFKFGAHSPTNLNSPWNEEDDDSSTTSSSASSIDEDFSPSRPEEEDWEKMDSYPTTFFWKTAANSVKLAASFTNWAEHPIEMHKDALGIFSTVVDLPVGIHTYKFIVDGVWRVNPDQPTMEDENHNLNNCVNITRMHVDENHSRVPRDWEEFESTKKIKRNQSNNEEKVMLNQFMIPGVEDMTPIKQKQSQAQQDDLLETMVNSFHDDAKGFKATDNTAVLSQRKLLLVMVGLPARGKSFVAKKLCRYLNWIGFKSKVFNLAQYRRVNLGAFHSHDFFRSDNPEGRKQRDRIAKIALKDTIDYLHDMGNVAIFDGCNASESRRKMIKEKVNQQKWRIGIKVIFIEIICNIPEIIERNIQAIKEKSVDYEGVDPDLIIDDFKERILHYQEDYVTVDDDCSYVKTFDMGRQIVTNRIHGFLPNRIGFYLSNVNTIPRPVFLTRHGESVFNTLGKMGGDSLLTPDGVEYAVRLEKYFKENQTVNLSEMCIWSSTMRRAAETAEPLSGSAFQYVRWKVLEEIDVGKCDGMSYDEFETQMPAEAEERRRTKLNYRFPRGESYLDLIIRLEPVIIELERERRPVLIIAHRAVLRCLFAYLTDASLDAMPHLTVPLHCVLKLEPNAYNSPYEWVDLGPRKKESSGIFRVLSDM